MTQVRQDLFIQFTMMAQNLLPPLWRVFYPTPMGFMTWLEIYGTGAGISIQTLLIRKDQRIQVGRRQVLNEFFEVARGLLMREVADLPTAISIPLIILVVGTVSA
jgi:hypothetical protein